MNKKEKDIDADTLLEFTKSSLMKDIYSKLINVAKTNSNVILIGEQGVGKSFAARLIYKESMHTDGPFYEFFCPAIRKIRFQEAFHGRLKIDSSQIKIKHPAIEKAKGGILFLNNFSDLPLEDQIHITEVISGTQKNQASLAVSDKKQKIRVIISIERKAFQRISNQKFWRYIMKHLNPISIWLPPLRLHREDIPPLIELFLSRYKQKKENRNKVKITLRALYKCISFNWPGNIQQLENAIKNAFFHSDSKFIKAEHLPFSLNWELWNNTEAIATEQLKSFQNAEEQLLSNFMKTSRYERNKLAKFDKGRAGLQKTFNSVANN